MRWWILVMMSFVNLICYLDRGLLGVLAPEISKEFHLSKTQMGLALACFTWTYALGQIPSGWLGDRFGPKKVLSFLMFGVGLTPFLNGIAVGLVTLVVARLALGLAESGAFALTARGMQMWFSRSERGRIQGISHGCGRIGAAIGPGLAAVIMLFFGWRTMFFVCGIIGFLWVIVFNRIYCNNPAEHKRVNQAELAQIRGLNPDGSIKPYGVPVKPRVPWRSILGSPNMWYIVLGYCCYFFFTNFYQTWYPTYLREYRHMSLKSLGILGTLPLAVALIGSFMGGFVTDAILKKSGKPKFSRRVVAAPGYICAGICIIPAALTHSTLVSVLCLGGAYFCLELASAAVWAVPMDVGGAFSGSVVGVMNGCGALAASMTAILYGAMFDRGFWIAPFYVTAGVMFLGALIWLFLINPERSVIERSSPSHVSAAASH